LSTLLGGPKVYTHVPQGTDPPYLVVLGGDEMPWAPSFEEMVGTFGTDGGDSGGRQCDVLVQCVSVYRGTEQVDALAGQVMTVLTDPASWTVTALPTWQVTEFVRNTSTLPTDLNGVLWFQRTVSVRVTVQ
jgi:hypothetical protein